MDLSKEITVLIKTFERPDACRRLIASVKKYYPSVHIIVIDDSHEPTDYGNVEYHHTEFDIGVSAGRNLGLSFVKTPYVWHGDDDCEFTMKTDLAKCIELLNAAQVDIIGMEATGVNWKGRFQFDGKIARMISDPYIRIDYPQGKVEIYDFIPNIFVARTEKLRKHPWDERLKTGEHFAHFWANWKEKKLKVGYTEDVLIIHGFPEKPSPEYKRHRQRATSYVQLFLREAGIEKRIDLQGEEIDANDESQKP